MPIDWKNATDYPPVKGTSLQRWTYEFLRRNQGFMAEFKAAKSESKLALNGEPVFWSETPAGKVLKKYGVKHLMLPEWMAEGMSDSPVIFTVHPIYVHGQRVEKAGAMFTNEAVGKYYKIILEQPDKQVLEFDLSQPLNPQLARAKQMLKVSQIMIKGENIRATASVTLFPWYLRVLDAYHDGIHPAKICEVLGLEGKEAMSDDTLKNWKKAGELMRDSGYRDLVKKPTR